MLCREGHGHAERVKAFLRRPRLCREGQGFAKRVNVCQEGQRSRVMLRSLCSAPEDKNPHVLHRPIGTYLEVVPTLQHCIDLTRLTLEVLPTFVDLSGFTLEDLLTLCRSNRTYTKDQFCVWSTEVKANCPPVYGAVQRQRHHCGADWGAGREDISE